MDGNSGLYHQLHPEMGKAPWWLLYCPSLCKIDGMPSVGMNVDADSAIHFTHPILPRFDWMLTKVCQSCDKKWTVCIHCPRVVTFLTTKQQILRHNSSVPHRKNRAGDGGVAANLSSEDCMEEAGNPVQDYTNRCPIESHQTGMEESTTTGNLKRAYEDDDDNVTNVTIRNQESEISSEVLTLHEDRRNANSRAYLSKAPVFQFSSDTNKAYFKKKNTRTRASRTLSHGHSLKWIQCHWTIMRLRCSWIWHRFFQPLPVDNKRRSPESKSNRSSCYFRELLLAATGLHGTHASPPLHRIFESSSSKANMHSFQTFRSHQ